MLYKPQTLSVHLTKALLVKGWEVGLAYALLIRNRCITSSHLSLARRMKEPCGNEEEKGKQVLLTIIDNIKIDVK